MQTSKLFGGVGVALVTPFTAQKEIDFPAYQRLLDHVVKGGVNYLVVMGTTGEAPTISLDERKQILEYTKKHIQGKVPIVIGIGGNNTANVIEEIKSTDLSQIDALLSVSPYYSKPQQEGIYQHFKAISKASPVDIILYNVPGRTSSNMSPETTLRLAKDFENIIAVKEAGNNVHQYLKLLRDKPEDFLIISGDDDLVLGVVLAGGAGVISVLGQAVPKQFTKMIKLGLEGKAKEAYAIHFKLMDLTSLIFSENNPAGIKAVLEALNLSKSTVRLPLVEASKELKQNINQSLKKLES